MSSLKTSPAGSARQGLRARQKADRRQRILESASHLFQKMGYEAARIEDIAEGAELSVGTLYNYYTNKGDILVATVAMEVEEVLELGETTVLADHRSVAEALEMLVGEYYDHSLMYLSKEMWRTAMALSIQQPETPFSRRYTELDGRLSRQVCALMLHLQRRGIVRQDVDAHAVGELLFNNLNMMFIEFVKSDGMTLEDLRQSVSRQNAPLAALVSSRSTV